MYLGRRERESSPIHRAILAITTTTIVLHGLTASAFTCAGAPPTRAETVERANLIALVVRERRTQLPERDGRWRWRLRIRKLWKGSIPGPVIEVLSPHELSFNRDVAHLLVASQREGSAWLVSDRLPCSPPNFISSSRAHAFIEFLGLPVAEFPEARKAPSYGFPMVPFFKGLGTLSLGFLFYFALGFRRESHKSERRKSTWTG